MNLNEASHIADVAMAGREQLPPLTAAERANGGRRRRGWKGFYGSLHDIVGCFNYHPVFERLMECCCHSIAIRVR